MQITASTPLCGLIGENPSLIPVLDRFGIRLGVGEATLGEIAARHGVDADFVAGVLGAYTGEGYIPEHRLLMVDPAQVAAYLQRTNDYYLRVQLPNIERHLGAFIKGGNGENSPLGMLGEIFGSFKRELTERIASDAQMLPRLTTGGRVHIADCSLAGQLSEMRNIMIRYLSGDYDPNLCYAVILALGALERDITCNDRIRELLWHRAHAHRNAAAPSGKALTARETDVLRLIVQGKINREIADELFISFNTVLTHRKNITSKLGIKSVSGLTMYALMHGLV